MSEKVQKWRMLMSGKYDGMAIGVFELDSECACFVALDAAAKTADVKIQSVERNRLGAGACVKMRGTISDVNAAMEAVKLFCPAVVVTSWKAELYTVLAAASSVEE